MLTFTWKGSSVLSKAQPARSVSHGAGKGRLHAQTLRTYSTVRRRVVTAKNDPEASIYTAEDAALAEKKRKELDRDFDETFFRKPKVLIIGTDVAAMTAALALQTYNIKPDILDTGHYMHPLAPTNVRGQIVPMSAMRVFDSLGVARDIEAIGSPLTIYGRSDKQGGALASLNFSSLRTYQDRPTLGVNYLDLERTLQSIVAKKTPFKPQCVVELIESEPVPDMKLAHVRWISNFLTSRTVEKGLYDAVIVSDGLFSMSREKHWPSAHALEGVAQIYEAVIPRPAKVMKGYASDQWCGDKRVGFFPVEGSNQDLLYVYGMTRLAEHGGPSDKSPSSSKPVEGSEVAKSDKKEPAPPKQERVPATVMLKLFGEIGGPWRDVAEAISALPSVNSTVVLSGYFTAEHPPVKGRVVAIGNSGFALPAPFLGHDLGTAVESAQYVANTIAINTAPLIYAIHGFNKEYYNMGPVLEASRTELRSALFLESRLPNFITKWMMKTTSSDKALVAQQIELLGLKMTKQDQLDAFPIKRVQQLRKEWHSMSDAERDSTKREVERNLQAFTAQMEHELAELAESRQAKSP